VVATVAVRDEGIADLDAALDRHFAFLERDGALAARRARQLERRTRDVLERAVKRWAWSDAGPRAVLEAALAEVAAGRRSPYDAAAAAVERIRRSDGA
jgi:LAO/AO transport system kinase